MEQLVNLLSTTLAAPYVPASGSLVITSAAGFPAVGTFSVLVLDQTTKNPKLLATTTARAGTTLTITVEGTDTACASGDIVIAGMLSAASVVRIQTDWNGFGAFANLPAAGLYNGQRYKCSDSEYEMIWDSGRGLWVACADGRPCLRPDISTFANHGRAPGNSDNTRGPFYMDFVNGTTGYQFVLFTKALPGVAPYTVTLGYRGYMTKNIGDQVYFGAVLREAATGKFWLNGIGIDYNGITVIFFSNPTTFGGTLALNNVDEDWAFSSGDQFVRVQDDGVNWSYFIGKGGAVDPSDPSNTNWTKVFQQPHNTAFTPDEGGFAMGCQNTLDQTQAMEVIHYSATTP